ncbi:predicted protein [Sclerotinia sclerotiorum 1980 UF-70]|uniref:Uncharacterized protein n=1 Tax=Sclerotinia sclerotiorum (strain ATCC 18683 / 1980 / Ss-1) TaxID=665079 RepID=A7ECV1_SCLS1|nr:predicted protein [Sclerotinia sclerotiorum 1980 UF-70]EDO00667.1 predicted protein [Sclerotinia sclerotiorum 1980 UF-70]
MVESGWKETAAAEAYCAADAISTIQTSYIQDKTTRAVGRPQHICGFYFLQKQICRETEQDVGW